MTALLRTSAPSSPRRLFRSSLGACLLLAALGFSPQLPGQNAADSAEEPAVLADAPLAPATVERLDLAPTLEQLLEEKRYGEAQRLLASQLEDPSLSALQAKQLRLQSARVRLEQIRQRDPLAADAAGATVEEELLVVLEDLRQLSADVLSEAEARTFFWASVQETIGFVYLQMAGDAMRRRGWSAFDQALRVYATSSEIEAARERYLDLLYRIFFGEAMDPTVQVSFPADTGVREWLDNAVQISRSDIEQNASHWLMAKYLESQPRSENTILRLGENLEAAVQAGESTPFYYRALFEWARWQARFGARSFNESGRVEFSPDFERAAELFERVVEGSTDAALAEAAGEALSGIRRVTLDVFVSNAFKPETEPFFFVRWKNMEALEVQVYPVDLIARTEAPVSAAGLADDLRGSEVASVFSARIERNASRRYYTERERVRIDTPLAPGAYLVQATGGGREANGLLFVTNLVLVTKTVGQEALFFLCDAARGEPVPNGQLRLFAGASGEDDGAAEMSEVLQMDASGLAIWKLPQNWVGRSIYAFAAAGGDQIYAILYAQDQNMPAAGGLSVFAYADRGLAVAGQEVMFKGILRTANALPPGLEFRVVGPAGTVLSRGPVETNSFNCFESSFRLPPDSGAGPVLLELLNAAGTVVASDQLLYVGTRRSPEFDLRMEVDAPGSTADQQYALLAGEPIEGQVRLLYADGGAVPGASVRVLVEQRPLGRPEEQTAVQSAFESRPYELVRQLSLSTDANGLARFVVETSREERADVELRMTAVVTDRNAAAVQATALVRVTQQAYFVSLEPEEKVFSPGEVLKVTIRTVDAMGKPVSVRGQIRLRRERWSEVYVHYRRGNEISGAEYRALPERSLMGSARSDYRLKEQGFVTEDVYSEAIATSDAGVAEITLKNPDVGFYRLTWLSQGRRGLPVRAEERIWVANEGDLTVAYRSSGVELIADAEVHAPGQTAQVLMITQQSNPAVLLVRGRDRIEQAEVLRLQGNGRLLSVPVAEADVPAVRLEALLVQDSELASAVVVLPVRAPRQDLRLALEMDRVEYEPGEEAEVRIRSTNGLGEPVTAEVALSVVPGVSSGSELPAGVDFNRDVLRQGASNLWTSLDWISFFDPSRLEDVFSLETSFGMLNDLREMSGTGAFGALFKEAAPAARGEDLASERALQAEADAAVRGTAVAPTLSPVAPGTQPIFWQAALPTGEDGVAVARFRLPDSIASWTVRAVGVRDTGRVAEVTTDTRTRLPLVVTFLQPNFLRAGDLWSGSAHVSNNTLEAQTIETRLSVEGSLEAVASPEPVLELRANSEIPLDLRVRALPVGLTRASGGLRIEVSGDGVADVEEGVLDVLPVHRTDFQIRRGLLDRSADELWLEVPAPDPLYPDAAPTLIVTPGVAPLLLERAVAVAQNDPELLGNLAAWERLLPAVVTAGTLENLGFGASDLQSLYRAFAPAARRRGVEPREAERYFDEWVRARVALFLAARTAEGAWPWMDGGEADALVTAHVHEALELVRSFGYAVPEDALEGARMFLESRLLDTEWTPAEQSIILKSLSSRYRAGTYGRPRRVEARVLDRLVRQADALDAASLARVIHITIDFGFVEDAEDLVVLLRRRAREAPSGAEPRVYWAGSGAGAGRSDSGSSLEATALALEAFLRLSPDHSLVRPSFEWLIMNGRAYVAPGFWQSVSKQLALSAYVREFVDLDVDATVEVVLDGQRLATIDTGPTEILTSPRRFELPSPAERVGVRRTEGGAPVFLELSRRSAAPGPIEGEGEMSGFRLERKVYHLRPTPTLLSGFREETVVLQPNESVRVQDRLEISLIVTADEESRFLSVHCPLPAGFGVIGIADDDQVVLREIFPAAQEEARARMTGRELQARVQGTRDSLILALDRVPVGVWEIRFRLRAEHRGEFILPPAWATLHMRPDGQSATDGLLLKVQDEEQ